MESLGKKLEDIFASVAFAEAGEHEKAREILKSRKTVLLAVSDRMFDRSALKYALNISKRIDASLEILYVTESDKGKAGLKDFLSEVEKADFRFSLVMKKGCVKKAILDYTEERGEILFVIVGSAPELDIECSVREKSLSDAWKTLKCPLVVVSKAEMPMTA